MDQMRSRRLWTIVAAAHRTSPLTLLSGAVKVPHAEGKRKFAVGPARSACDPDSGDVSITACASNWLPYSVTVTWKKSQGASAAVGLVDRLCFRVEKLLSNGEKLWKKNWPWLCVYMVQEMGHKGGGKKWGSLFCVWVLGSRSPTFMTNTIK